MGIIDKQGFIHIWKFKINIIDFLVLVFILCLAPTFYFGYKVANRKVEVTGPARELVEFEANYRFIKVRPEALELISVGDKEFDKNGQEIGEIVGVGGTKPYEYELDVGQGQKIIREDSMLKQIEVRLKLKAELREDKPYYKDKIIKINSPLEFETSKYSVLAVPYKEVIVTIEERMIDLFVSLRGLSEITLKLISVGDKEVDATGRTIAEIVNLGEIEESSIEFNLGSGNFLLGQESGKKQISTKMRLRCQIKVEEAGVQLYFKGKRIGHNQPFEFKTDKYRAMGVVAKTFEVTPPLRKKWITLQAKFSGISPEIANAIDEGDIEKDVFEQTVGRINSVLSNKPSEVLMLKQDEFITLNHPFYKDMLILFDVQCTEKGGVYYFKNYPVKMGNNIVFSADLYTISGLIVGIEIK